MNHELIKVLRKKLDDLTISDYHGLSSPGLTCYLNCVLQVLFMTNDFREEIRRCRREDSAGIDTVLGKLFDELERSLAKTHNITKKLGITDVYKQSDAAEYFEKILCLSSTEASKIFKGQLNHKTTCVKCKDSNDSRSFFWILPLTVEDSCRQTYSVERGLKAFFKGEKACGDNKMYCSSCDKKQDADIDFELTQNPKILTLLLKRFSFDHKHRRYVKLHCRVDVPQTLNIEQCTYDLYALVNHFGNLTGGHYTADIKSFENGEWYRFNDDIVERVQQPLFGAGSTSVRSHTAYLLMYRKAHIKYHGLFNQGATCYLNSVLQVLFMTKDFREAVESYTCENPDTEFFDCHLKALFDDLRKQTAVPCKITTKLGIVDVYEQHDAAEYFEKILTLTSPRASRIFRGQLTHQTKCSTCGTVTVTDGAFWHLPLALVNAHRQTYSVVNGITEFFKASDISGDNQLFCDECDAKTDATVQCVIKDHPDILMLLLKRFEFDYRYMRHVKRNNVVGIPDILQIPENQTYELYAVVDHSGDLRGGHYTAEIKSQDDERWYSFNDSSVTLHDYKPFQLDNADISRRAYLLFYKKKKTCVADTRAPDIRDLSISGDFSPATNDNNNQCQDVDQIREGEEGGEIADVGNETAEAVQAGMAGRLAENQGDGGIRRTKVGNSQPKQHSSLSSNFICKAEDWDNGADVRQSRPYNNRECNEGKREGWGYLQDAHIKKPEEDEGKLMKDAEERGKAGADDQAEKRGQFFPETQPRERVKDQDYANAGRDVVRRRRPDVHHDVKPEVSDRQERQRRVEYRIRQDRSFTQAGMAGRLAENQGDGGIRRTKVGNSQPKQHSSLSSNFICKAEDWDNGADVRQSKPYNNRECNEGKREGWGYLQDAHIKKPEEDEGKLMKDAEERGKAGADDQAEKRGQFFPETQPRERVKDQDYANAGRDVVRRRRPDIHHDVKPEVSDRQERQRRVEYRIRQDRSFTQAGMAGRLAENQGDGVRILTLQERHFL
ncbi:uncharacterized protein LOC120797713 [Xiphias gladius]|uniref:uncharacterized protein LOC120797713 n=1 Tax=Xiphias gladius TaxID=8245 RepID=UPI001A981903|nr:uncharacterized protein LOC120797713 [Xiphias gladius]